MKWPQWWGQCGHHTTKSQENILRISILLILSNQVCNQRRECLDNLLSKFQSDYSLVISFQGMLVCVDRKACSMWDCLFSNIQQQDPYLFHRDIQLCQWDMLDIHQGSPFLGGWSLYLLGIPCIFRSTRIIHQLHTLSVRHSLSQLKHHCLSWCRQLWNFEVILEGWCC